MSIFEYDEEKELEKLRRTEYAFGREKGLETGRAEGRELGRQEERARLIGIIRRMLDKKLDVKAIAELLELDEEYVNKAAKLICDYTNDSDLDIAVKMTAAL